MTDVFSLLVTVSCTRTQVVTAVTYINNNYSNYNYLCIKSYQNDNGHLEVRIPCTDYNDCVALRTTLKTQFSTRITKTEIEVTEIVE